ncbi:hypothetical protein D1B31_09515 [Neobacillus notoginsengisoli]|uniref:YfjL-like N-terminal domain-containing protein n=1 Tax=Neobacillus notoginsengisoli TaxID=1578198 RepID=A0A417YV37_9BACI|nr:hypothetical protein [Neobacillus notoginsengisoli]RHW41163.1 hypothetical protein D1B31_09515 [Neobacillus notoginsengisoli]
MKRKTIFSITAIALLAAGLFMLGNPITRVKSKQAAEQYLKNTYRDQTYEIEKVGYYPGEGTYVIHVKFEDGQRVNLDVKNGKVIGQEP